MTQPSDTSQTTDADEGSAVDARDNGGTRASTTETSGIDISDADVDDTEGGSPS